MGVFKSQFVSSQGEINLRAYKYVGSDKSILYRVFFSPVAQFVVDKIIPTWLAPNAITLIGFFCTLIPHLIILYNFPRELDSNLKNVPSWMCYLAAAGQLIYMILDNADGKQARKTGSSSPLGLLFDHGCDAMNTFISGLTLFTILQIGNTPLAIWAYIIVMTGFFMATWEEYYVNALNLPIINGANEGIVIFIVMFVISGIFGSNIWLTKYGSLHANEIVLIAFAVMGIATFISNIVNVYKGIENKRRIFGALFNLSTIIYMIATTMFVTYFSKTDVVSRQARILIYFVGFSFAKLVGHVQAAHVAHEEFQQFRKTIIFSFSVLNVHTLLGHFSDNVLFKEDYILYGCCAYAFIVYVHFAVNITSQFAKILNIYVFKIGPKEIETGLLDPETSIEIKTVKSLNRL